MLKLAVITAAATLVPPPAVPPAAVEMDRWQRHLVGSGDTMIASWLTVEHCPNAAAELWPAHVGTAPPPPKQRKTVVARSAAFETAVPWSCTRLPDLNATGNASRVVHTHDAKFTGLAVSGVYSYRVGSPACGWSDLP